MLDRRNAARKHVWCGETAVPSEGSFAKRVFPCPVPAHLECPPGCFNHHAGSGPSQDLVLAGLGEELFPGNLYSGFYNCLLHSNNDVVGRVVLVSVKPGPQRVETGLKKAVQYVVTPQR